MNATALYSTAFLHISVGNSSNWISIRDTTGTRLASFPWASFFSGCSVLDARFLISSTKESLTDTSTDIELSSVTVSCSRVIFFPANSSVIHFAHDLAPFTAGKNVAPSAESSTRAYGLFSLSLTKNRDAITQSLLIY
jgi:hypothetical protein